MTQNDDIVMARIAFLRGERASQLRSQRPKRKESRSHTQSGDGVREVVSLKRQTIVIFVGCNMRKEVGLFPRFLYFSSGEPRRRQALLTLNGYGLNESIRLRDRQRIKQHRARSAENRCRGTDTKRQRKYCHC